MMLVAILLYAAVVGWIGSSPQLSAVSISLSTAAGSSTLTYLILAVKRKSR
jgi:hypothetical protein